MSSSSSSDGFFSFRQRLSAHESLEHPWICFDEETSLTHSLDDDEDDDRLTLLINDADNHYELNDDDDDNNQLK